MHDITEGGIYEALFEISKLLRRRITVNENNIIIRNEIRNILSQFNISPYSFISSGSFLVITDEPEKIVSEVPESSIIGRIESKSEPEVYISDKGSRITEEVNEELVEFENSYNEWRERD